MLFFWGDGSFPFSSPEYFEWKRKIAFQLAEEETARINLKNKERHVCLEHMLRRAYTSDEMDRGDDMKFHPMDGKPFGSDICYSEQDKVYFYIGAAGTYDLERIGDGQNRLPGALYLPHWTHDPFTGHRL